MKERFFNTAGPIQRDIHYYLPPLERLDKDELFSLIDARKYFVLHAPRQTGKTSCLLALRDELNRRGEYACVYANIETAQSARENVTEAMRTILGEIASRARETLGDTFLKENFIRISEQKSGAFGPEYVVDRMGRAFRQTIGFIAGRSGCTDRRYTDFAVATIARRL